MPRPLPSTEEALQILRAKRTRRIPVTAPVAGRSLGPLIKALDAKFGQGPEGLQARWREIVGETLARRTEPVKLTKPRGGAGAVLDLRVDGPAAALIQHQAPDILARVNLFLGAGSVARLRVVQGPVRRPPAEQAAATVSRNRRRSARPLDAAVEADLESSLARLADGRLKTALRGLGREVLRQVPSTGER
jgi:hypothetical protein